MGLDGRVVRPGEPQDRHSRFKAAKGGCSLSYGVLKCVSLRKAGFEMTKPGKPPRLIKQAVWADTSKYNGEELRAIRAEKGVGRPWHRLILPPYDTGDLRLAA